MTKLQYKPVRFRCMIGKLQNIVTVYPEVYRQVTAEYVRNISQPPYGGPILFVNAGFNLNSTTHYQDGRILQ